MTGPCLSGDIATPKPVSTRPTIPTVSALLAVAAVVVWAEWPAVAVAAGVLLI